MFAIFTSGITALWAVYLIMVFTNTTSRPQIAESLMASLPTTTLGACNPWIMMLSVATSLANGIVRMFFPN